LTSNLDHIPEEQRGPAEQLFDIVLKSGAHLWHNRPGLRLGDRWLPARGNARRFPDAERVTPGLFVPAAVELYGRLLEIYELNADLMARFASYALLETDWRDLKVACAALMLVQPLAGQPIREDDGTIAFHEDDYRTIGEAMLLHYQRGSSRMMTPKSVVRVAELLESPDIAELNRAAGFADPASGKPPLGRWKSAARKWLRVREQNRRMLEGLVNAGYKNLIRKLARKCGYKPESAEFFSILGWKQKQSSEGHRSVGMGELELRKQARFDGLDEAAICERIAAEKLGFKQVVGRLPAGTGLTPAIMVALLPSLTDKDLRLLTPTLEDLGLLGHAPIRDRWEQAVARAEDLRALHIAKNVRNRELREKLEEAADHAVKRAVEEAAGDRDLHVMFLIDKSGSMEGAIEQSKEALSRILAGFPAGKLHIATFDSTGTVLEPKAASRKAVEHMLQRIRAGGGTFHGAAVHALHGAGVRVPDDAALVVIVVGDEQGESGEALANTFRDYGYQVAAVAMIVCVASGWSRGRTVRDAAAHLAVPFCDVEVDAFDDPYQVTRALTAILEAPIARGGAASAWLDRVMAAPLLGIETTVLGL
jgi:hypothetical protein